MPRPLCLATFALAAACSSPPSDEADDAGPDAAADPGFVAELDRLVAPHVDAGGSAGKAVGLVVVAVGSRARLVAGYGATAIGGPQPGPDTYFEIGSVTKVFTGLLLARALDRGTVALADPIDPQFPAGAPDWNGQAIALVDLATHSSGLPGMPDNLHSSDPQNPGAGYTTQDLSDFMASHVLVAAPGSTLRYSNLGAGTLGHVLVQRMGAANYEALVSAELAGPLAMSDTIIAVPDADRARVATGHRDAVAAAANVIGEPLAGGGALRSTGADMLRFVDAALGRGDPSVVAAWTLALVPQRPFPMGTDGQLGLLIARETNNGRFQYHKSGQTAGFSSFVIFTTSPPAAVVVLANASELAESRALETLAREVLALLDR